MKFCVLGSGSKGNATFVEAGRTRLLIDAGFSGVEVERRLLSLGVAAESIDGILISHEHIDHIRGAQVLSRRYQVPLLITEATLRAAGKNLARVENFRKIEAGQPFSFNDLEIHPFSVSHDAVDPLGFVISNDGCLLGYCTDTGITSRLMHHRLSGCNGLILECNHDLEMLKNGGYPLQVQQRIRSKSGHLTNTDAARFLVELIHDGLEHVVLAHLSEANNSRDLVRRTVEEHLANYDLTAIEKRRFHLAVARQDKCSEMIRLQGRYVR